ncbi:MAG: hypothetical protein J5850_02580, partial [Clostridia bacterium]|nr:hypothetical protein [Clostridia bacterium]
MKKSFLIIVVSSIIVVLFITGIVISISLLKKHEKQRIKYLTDESGEAILINSDIFDTDYSKDTISLLNKIYLSDPMIFMAFDEIYNTFEQLYSRYKINPLFNEFEKQADSSSVLLYDYVASDYYNWNFDEENFDNNIAIISYKPLFIEFLLSVDVYREKLTEDEIKLLKQEKEKKDSELSTIDNFLIKSFLD